MKLRILHERQFPLIKFWVALFPSEEVTSDYRILWNGLYADYDIGIKEANKILEFYKPYYCPLQDMAELVEEAAK